MRSFLLIAIIFFCRQGVAQDSTERLRSFPITDYITPLGDSVRLVQVYLPAGPVLKDKQLGILQSVYTPSSSDTGTVGWGRCNLIKGDYYYFSIRHTSLLPHAGDLLYVHVKKTSAYEDRLLKVAAHCILFTDVQENKWYDPAAMFDQWTKKQEMAVIDSMVGDIRFTGRYFLEHDASMNLPIIKGGYKGRKVLDVMTAATSAEVITFLDYVIARPRLYAGKEWKIAETFATWLTEGAPHVEGNR